MSFKDLLIQAKDGSHYAQEKIFLLYRPLLFKEACVYEVFDEDLFQELSMTLVDCIRLFRFRNNRRMGNFAAQDSHSRSYYPDAYCFKIPVIRMAASCCGCGYRDSDHRRHHRYLADFFLIKAGDVFCM